MGSKLIRLWNNLRLRYNALTKSAGFFVHLNKDLYSMIGGHDKVIHWRDGQPVYSSFFLPGYSKVKAHHQAVRVIASMQNRVIPYMVDFALTDECNFDCEFCSFKSMKDKRKEMSTEEIKDVIAQCQELGICVINFVGGEPLMRKDILEIIKSVDKNKSSTLMFTNGWFLEKYAHKLKKAGLDSVNVSIDSHIPEKHDSIKNKKGAFRKAVRGIVQAKKAGLTVGISCTVSKESLEDGSFLKLIELGKKLKVHEIIFWDLIPIGGLVDRKDLIDNTKWTEKIIKIANFYNQKYNYPGIFSYAYNRTPSSMGCSGGTNYFYITPYGDICPCDFNPLVLGNVLEKPLNLIWDDISKNPEFCRTSWNGCKVQDSKYRKKVGFDLKKCAKCRGSK